MRLTTWAASIAALLMFAKSSLAGGIEVVNATIAAPVVPTARAAAATFVIRNVASVDDQLTGIETPSADAAEIHKSVDANGVMRMEAVPSLVIPAHAEIDLAVQHMHLMLSGLRQPLREGDVVELVFHFEHAGNVAIKAGVAVMP